MGRWAGCPLPKTHTPSDFYTYANCLQHLTRCKERQSGGTYPQTHPRSRNLRASDFGSSGLASPGVSPRRKGPTPKLATTPLLRGYTWNFVSTVGLKTRMMAIPDRQKVCIYLDTLTALFGQTDGIAKIISRSACIVC